MIQLKKDVDLQLLHDTFHVTQLGSVAQSCPTLSTPWTAAHQDSLSNTSSRSLLKLMFIELVMPSSHFILCCPLLLLPSIFPNIRVFTDESTLRIRWPKYWSFSFSVSPSREYSGSPGGKCFIWNQGSHSNYF